MARETNFIPNFIKIRKIKCVVHKGEFLNVTGWKVRGPNSGGGGGEIFRTRPDRPHISLPGVKRLVRDVGHPPHPAPRLKKAHSYIYIPQMGLRGLF